MHKHMNTVTDFAALYKERTGQNQEQAQYSIYNSIKQGTIPHTTLRDIAAPALESLGEDGRQLLTLLDNSLPAGSWTRRIIITADPNTYEKSHVGMRLPGQETLKDQVITLLENGETSVKIIAAQTGAAGSYISNIKAKWNRQR